MDDMQDTCSAFLHESYDLYERLLDSLVFQFNTVVCLGILRPNLAMEIAMKNLNCAQQHCDSVVNHMEYLIHVARLLAGGYMRAEKQYIMAVIEGIETMDKPEEEEEEAFRGRLEKMKTTYKLFIRLRDEYKHSLDETGPAVGRAEYKAALYRRRDAKLVTNTTINTAGSDETVAELLAGLKIVYEAYENALASQVEKHHSAVYKGIVETDSALRVATSNVSFVNNYLQSVKSVGWHFVQIATLMTLLDPTPAQPEPDMLVAADSEEEDHNPAAPAPALATERGAQSGST